MAEFGDEVIFGKMTDDEIQVKDDSKIQRRDSSSSNSDSDSVKKKKHDDDAAVPMKSKIHRLFGREEPLHKVLGGGKAADILLWRNKKTSGSVFGGATALWVLFELLEYHLLTLLSHFLILVLAILFLWSNTSKLINKSPPSIPQVQIPEDKLFQIATELRIEINNCLRMLRDIASGRDLNKFLAVVAGLWILSVVGSWCSFLTLFYIGFLVLATVPVAYEMYEEQVDAFAEKVTMEIKKQYAVLDARVLSKIPREPFKHKKKV